MSLIIALSILFGGIWAVYIYRLGFYSGFDAGYDAGITDQSDDGDYIGFAVDQYEEKE